MKDLNDYQKGELNALKVVVNKFETEQVGRAVDVVAWEVERAQELKQAIDKDFIFGADFGEQGTKDKSIVSFLKVGENQIKAFYEPTSEQYKEWMKFLENSFGEESPLVREAKRHNALKEMGIIQTVITGWSKNGKTRITDNGQTPEQRYGGTKTYFPQSKYVDSTNVRGEYFYLQVVLGQFNGGAFVALPLTDFIFKFMK